ncbi:MAG: hypothetical protein RLN69_06150 [Woeseiaceae bacterium]
MLKLLRDCFAIGFAGIVNLMWDRIALSVDGAVFLYEPVTAGIIVACAVIVVGIALATGNFRARAVRHDE